MAATVTLNAGNGDELSLSTGNWSLAGFDFGRPGPNRQIVLILDNAALTPDGIWSDVRAIRRKLRQAELGYGTTGRVAGVSLDVNLSGVAEAVSFDLRVDPATGEAGIVTVPQGAIQNPGFPQHWLQGVMVQLYVEPYARGEAESIGPFTLDDASLFTCHQASIKGDRPALATWYLEDQSTGSAVVNRLVIGSKSQEDLDSGDWDGLVNVSAVSPATNVADAAAIGGTVARLAAASVTTGAWNSVGSATTGTPAADQAGVYDIWARVRDAASLRTAPTNLAVTSVDTLGTLDHGAFYEMRIVALDGSSNESGSSNLVTRLLLFTQDRINLAWTAPSAWTPAGYRLYWRKNSGTWFWKNTGSASASYAFSSEASSTAGDPPEEGAVFGDLTEVRLQAGLSSGTTLRTYSPVPVQHGNSHFEDVKLASGVHWPPVSLPEGDGPEQGFARVQHNPVAAANFDVDCLWFVPSDRACRAEYLGLGLGTKRIWQIGVNRRGAPHGILRVIGTSAEAGQVSVTGNLRVGPGDTQILVKPEIADGVSDLDDAVLSLTIVYVPLYDYQYATL